MNSNDENGQDSGQPVPPPPKWLKIFLAVNLVALLGVFVWELGPTFKSGEEIGQIREDQAKAVGIAIEKNAGPADQTGKLNDELEYVIDATTPNVWVHLDFSKRAIFVTEEVQRESAEWDIAFRRAKIVTNGGATRKEGNAGIVAVAGDDFEAITSAPLEGYFEDQASDNPYETKNPILDKWYQYDFWTHQLKPKRVIYVVRTTDSHYAKVQIVNYYCDKAAGCYTLKYKYQGKDSRSFVE